MGAKIKFADVKYETHNIDPKKIEKLITKKLKYHTCFYHGLPCDLDEIIKLENIKYLSSKITLKPC